MRFSHFSIALCFALSACTVSKISESGKECPCTEPQFVCACGTQCVPAGEVFTCDAGLPDATPDMMVDALPDADDSCLGSVKITNLRVRWTTPNTIAIAWDPVSADPNPTVSYQIVLTPVDGGTARTIDAERNPELAHYFRPQQSEEQEIQDTIVDELEESTTYSIEFTATDSQSRTCTLELQARTQEAPSAAEMLIFQDELLGNYTQPTCFSVTTEGSHYDGDAHFSYQAICDFDDSSFADAMCEVTSDAPPPTCFALMKMVETEIPFSLSAGDFSNAYLEFAMRTPDATSFYGTVSFRVSDAGHSGSDPIFQLEPFTVRSGLEYSVFQIPLSSMSRLGSGDPLSFADLRSSMGAPRILSEFRVGSTALDDGHHIDVDAVRILWQ